MSLNDKCLDRFLLAVVFEFFPPSTERITCHCSLQFRLTAQLLDFLFCFFDSLSERELLVGIRQRWFLL